MSDDRDETPLEQRRLTQKELAREYRKAAYQKAKEREKARRAAVKEQRRQNPNAVTLINTYKEARKQKARDMRRSAYQKQKDFLKEKNAERKEKQRIAKVAQREEEQKKRDAELWDNVQTATIFPFKLRIVKNEPS